MGIFEHLFLDKGYGSPQLVHGVFNTQSAVLMAFRLRCAAKRIDFDRFSWVGPEHPPDFESQDSETVVVLDATLDSLRQTFEFAWDWMEDGQNGISARLGMMSKVDDLSLLEGVAFKPWMLRWVRIKLDAHRGRAPEDVRNAKTSPGCALLFMGAEHPERIRAMNHRNRFGFWVPGLDSLEFDGETQQYRRCAFAIYLARARCFMRMDSCPIGYANTDLAVPVFRE